MNDLSDSPKLEFNFPRYGENARVVSPYNKVARWKMLGHDISLYELAKQKARDNGVHFQDVHQFRELLEFVLSLGDNEFRTHDAYKLEKLPAFKGLKFPRDAIKRYVKKFNKAKIIYVSRVSNKRITAKEKRSSKYGKLNSWSDDEKVIKYYKTSEEFLVPQEPILIKPRLTSILDNIIDYQNALLKDLRQYRLGGTQYLGATYVFEAHNIFLESVGLQRRLDKTYGERKDQTCKQDIQDAITDFITIRDTAVKLEESFNVLLSTGKMPQEIWDLLNIIEARIASLSEKFKIRRHLLGLFSNF